MTFMCNRFAFNLHNNLPKISRSTVLKNSKTIAISDELTTQRVSWAAARVEKTKGRDVGSYSQIVLFYNKAYTRGSDKD